MARRSNPPAAKQPATLMVEQMHKGIDLLKRRLKELREFDPSTVHDQFHHPELNALGSRIEDTLVRVFGSDTLEFERYSSAANFYTGPLTLGDNDVPLPKVRQYIQKSKET